MMRNTEAYPFKEHFVIFSRYASLLAVLIGSLVLLGWIFDIQELRSVFWGFQTTKVNTAIVFILSGGILYSIGSEKKNRTYFYLQQAAAIVVLLIGLLTLSEYISNINLGIDEFLFKDTYTALDSFPGRMSFASAVCTTILGFALILINHPKEKVRVISQHLAILIITVSFLALIGYIYRVQALYKLSIYSNMGLLTSIAYLVCALAILWIRPDEGWTKFITSATAGGVVMRRLLLPILILPLILGWLILLGGRAGLYDMQFGLAIISVLIAGLLVITLLVNAEQLNKVDQNRRQAEESYQNVLDQMMEGAQIIGFDWRYLYVNDSVAQQGKQKREDLLGRTMMEVYPGIEHTDLFKTLNHCMKDRVPHLMENEFIFPEGSKGWFELSIQPVKEGIFILSNNVTERKHAEQRFHLTVEVAPNAILLINTKGEITMVNSQAENFFGYERTELIGLPIDVLVPERFKQNHTSYREGFLSNPEPRPMGAGRDLYGLRKDGSEFPIEIGLAPLETDGEIFIMATVVDITKRKHAEESVLKINKELELRIFERTANFNLTNERLQNELIQRHQAEEKIIHQNKMLADLHEITLDLLKQNNLMQLFQRIIDLSVEFLDAEYVEVLLVEADELVVKAATTNQKHFLGERVKRGEAVLSWQAFDTRQPAVLSNYSEWVHRKDIYNDITLQAVADFPILNNEKSVGILAFGRTKPNYDFTQEQIQFGKLFASLSALVIDHAQLRDTLREQSIRDPLTNLFNRRYMESTLREEISRAARQNHPLGVIMLDIDHFKNFNDTFGHVAGDVLLSGLAKFLQTSIRAEDIVCRYGGEEFILIMPNTSLDIVKQRAELLRVRISKVQAHTMIGVTISLGIAMYPQHCKTIESLILAADASLYRAKQNGRNRVEVADIDDK